MSGTTTLCAALAPGLLFLCALFQPRSRSLWVGAGAVGAVAMISLWQGGLLRQILSISIAAGLAVLGFALSAIKVRSRAPSMEGAAPTVPIECRPAVPDQGFAQLEGMADLKSALLSAGREALTVRGDAATWMPRGFRGQRSGSGDVRNGILLHGEPGNGKTVMAERLADELGIPMFDASISKVSSQFVGATTERLMAIIAEARRRAPSMLFLDEAESLLRARPSVDRSGGSAAADMNRTTNAFLTEVVKLRGSGVVVVAATNFLELLDEAAIREGRFDWKIEVTCPDEPARVGMLASGLTRHAHLLHVDDSVVRSAAARWRGFSTKRMLTIAEEAARYSKRTGKRQLSFNDLRAVLRDVQGNRALPPECAKSIQDLALGAPERAWLTGFAKRLQHAHELECAGGTLPTGLLLYGPPGTGKTEIARMLAKASGYAFFPVAGGDLISEPERIRKLWREAREMRPAIIFIDEADDVLQTREHSPHKATTNKILTEMDGAGGRIPDLLVIAATNSPEAIDPAALRGGRFTEKLEVLPPPPDQTELWIESWMATRGWSSDVSAADLARSLEGQAIANVSAVLQQAVNSALAEGDFTVRRLRHQHIDASMRVVLG